jgi:hypothetical protein
MKTSADEAIAEVRAARKALCDRFGNDPGRLLAHLRAKQRNYRGRIIKNWSGAQPIATAQSNALDGGGRAERRHRFGKSGARGGMPGDHAKSAVAAAALPAHSMELARDSGSNPLQRLVFAKLRAQPGGLEDRSRGLSLAIPPDNVAGTSAPRRGARYGNTRRAPSFVGAKYL